MLWGKGNLVIFCYPVTTFIGYRNRLEVEKSDVNFLLT